MYRFRLSGRQKKASALDKLGQAIDSAKVPENCCVYAVGDVHGMAELLRNLINRIGEDASFNNTLKLVVFLGDLIDRGPDSYGVIEFLLALQSNKEVAKSWVFLKGNHEQMLSDFLRDPLKHGNFWLRNGGDATLTSYGIDVQSDPTSKQLTYLRDQFNERLPGQHSHFFKNQVSNFTLGDYFFCHAGVEAGQPLDKQTDAHLLWSRENPDDTAKPYEKIIVHGHQPVVVPVVGRYHINVDTGAYVTGCLTAVKLFGAKREFISTRNTISEEKIYNEE